MIPTRDRAATLARTLASLQAQEPVPGDAELVVVDNGSRDGTAAAIEAAAEAGPFAVRAVREPALGPAAARNAGVRAARGEVILLLGDDTRPAVGDLLRRHARQHDRHPETTMILGRIEWDPRHPPTPFMRWLDDGGPQFHFRGLAPGPVPVAAHFYSSHVSLRRTLLEAVGGFDERFTQAAMEDIELGMRLDRQGARLVYDPELLVLHDHPTSYGESLRRMARVGAAARQLHELHPGVAHPGAGRPDRLRARAVRQAARALAPSHTGARLPTTVRNLRWRIVHLDAYYRGYESGP